MTTATAAYPLRVHATLDPGLSRWLWLVKWFLAIPHYVVLAFLWLAFFAVSVVAFFSILFTGRYPRGLFDFNVGVLRWTWRVAYYTYGALATDRYPPFSLGADPGYPATLDVAYPEHLSRGLVLVKWWLLAVPHYVIVGVFLGGTSYAAYEAGQRVYNSGGGLISLIALFAGVALLFTGRYPQGLFDFLLGMDRWGAAGRRLRRADDRHLSTVPPGHRRRRACRGDDRARPGVTRSRHQSWSVVVSVQT